MDKLTPGDLADEPYVRWEMGGWSGWENLNLN
jgi:hypothetical protein